MTKICLDPGHNKSGADTGASGNGLYEQDLTLDIALRLKPLLEFNGFQVVMTRDSDFVNGPHGDLNESLNTRCQIANQNAADLFVAIHVNAGGGTGVEAYSLPGGRAVICAEQVLNQIASVCDWTNRGVKTDRNLYVLVNTAMPAILTENGFVDNSDDAAKLSTEAFRQRIAEGHARGICDFYGISYRPPQIEAPKTTESDKNKEAIALFNKAIELINEGIKMLN